MESQVGYGLGEEEEGPNLGGIICARIESSYVVSLRDLDIKFVKDFVFLHGYTEPVVVVLHEKEPTWAGRVAVRRHTCAITALSINTTLKQHPLIWSAAVCVLLFYVPP
jgi:cleavage and polyadenylation specificity factor subunit 1